MLHTAVAPGNPVFGGNKNPRVPMIGVPAIMKIIQDRSMVPDHIMDLEGVLCWGMRGVRQWCVGAGGVRAVTVSICESEMFGKKAPTREWTLEELLDGTVLWGVCSHGNRSSNRRTG